MPCEAERFRCFAGSFTGPTCLIDRSPPVGRRSRTPTFPNDGADGGYYVGIGGMGAGDIRERGGGRQSPVAGAVRADLRHFLLYVDSAAAEAPEAVESDDGSLEEGG